MEIILETRTKAASACSRGLKVWLLWINNRSEQIKISAETVFYESCWHYFRSATIYEKSIVLLYICYCYIPRLSISQTSIVIGWLLLKCSWSNSNVSRLGFAQLLHAHRIQQHVISAWQHEKWRDSQQVLTSVWLLNFASHSREARRL